MAATNPSWGAPRSHGELRRLPEDKTGMVTSLQNMPQGFPLAVSAEANT